MKTIFSNFQFVLSISMSAVALISIGFFAILVYGKVVNLLENNMAINSSQVVGQVATTINVYVQDMVDVTDGVIREINTYHAPSDKLQEMLGTTKRLRKDIASLVLANNKGGLVAYAPQESQVKENVDILTQNWFPKTALSDEEYYFTPPHVQDLFVGQYKWVVTVYRNITMHSEKDEYTLTLVMDMNFESIDKYCSGLRIGKRGYVFILDENNNIIYHPQQNVIYSGTKTEDLDFIGQKPPGTYIQAENKIVTIEPVEYTNWKLIGVSYMDDYRAVYLDMLRYIIVAFVVVLVLVGILAYFTSLQVSRPIKRLAARMEEVESDTFSKPASESGFNEVRRLSSSFNKMTVRIRELMTQVRDEQEELRKTELRALQAQINPHFLYNTLDSILWMCEQQETERAVIMVSALSQLFRISISKGSEMITIREELTHAKSYLTIQKIRYRDQFDYTIEADESLMECKCLKVILQPFLENAIYHGIDRMVDKGILTIRVQEADDKILIQIIDNGLGILPETLNDLFEPKKEYGNQYGVGVPNVNNRIKIYFGKEYGIQIESIPDEGTTVSILLPKIVEEQKQ